MMQRTQGARSIAAHTLLPVLSMTPTDRKRSHAGTSSVTRMAVSLRICLLAQAVATLHKHAGGASVEQFIVDKGCIGRAQVALSCLGSTLAAGRTPRLP